MNNVHNVNMKVYCNAYVTDGYTVCVCVCVCMCVCVCVCVCVYKRDHHTIKRAYKRRAFRSDL